MPGALFRFVVVVVGPFSGAENVELKAEENIPAELKGLEAVEVAIDVDG